MAEDTGLTSNGSQDKSLESATKKVEKASKEADKASKEVNAPEELFDTVKDSLPEADNTQVSENSAGELIKPSEDPAEILQNEINKGGIAEDLGIQKPNPILDPTNVPKESPVEDHGLFKEEKETVSIAALSDLVEFEGVDERPSRFVGIGSTVQGELSLKDALGSLNNERYTSVKEAKDALNSTVAEFKKNFPNESAATYTEAEKSIQGYISHSLRDIREPDFGGNHNERRTNALRKTLNRSVDSDRKKEEGRQAIKGAKRLAAGKLLQIDDEFDGTLNEVDNDPRRLEESLKIWSGNFSRQAAKAGVSKLDILKIVKSKTKDLVATSLKSRIRDNPEKAFEFINNNAAALGSNAFKYKDIARKAAKKRTNNLSEATIKQDFSKFDVEQLTQAGKREGKEGITARKMKRAMLKDPLGYAENNGIAKLESISINDPESLSRRVLVTEELQEDLSSPDEIIETGILAKDEISRIKENYSNIQQTSSFMDMISEQPESVRNKVADDLGESAQSYAATLGLDDRGLARKIIQGAASQTKLEADQRQRNSLYPYDPVQDKRSNMAIEALIKGGMEPDEAIKEIYNVQTVNSGFLGFGGQELPLPRGVTAEEFDNAADVLLSDSPRIAEFANGEAKGTRTASGKPVQFDSDELDWVPISKGVYGLQNDDGEFILNKKGKILEIDMEKAIGEI